MKKPASNADGMAVSQADTPSLDPVTVNHDFETRPGFHGGGALESVGHDAAPAVRHVLSVVLAFGLVLPLVWLRT